MIWVKWLFKAPGKTLTSWVKSKKQPWRVLAFLYLSNFCIDFTIDPIWLLSKATGFSSNSFMLKLFLSWIESFKLSGLDFKINGRVCCKILI